ncbi:MAG: hypothetical protein Q7J64_00835, partial [Elusimicrobiota bacterium]|nr:hypothetical protein [Elusimicrobiota bacterium]
MTPRSLCCLGRKITATALAAALVLSGSGPIYAQEIRVISGQNRAPGYSGQNGASTLPNMLAPLSPSALGASLNAGLSAPSLTPSAAALGGHARVMPTLAAPSIVPSVSVAP